MHSIIHKVKEGSVKKHTVVLGTLDSDWSKFNLSENELDFLSKELLNGKRSILINQYSRYVFIECFEEQLTESIVFEKARERGAALAKSCNDLNLESVELVSASESDLTIFVAEGMALANYQFLKYFTDTDKKANSLSSILKS